MLAGLLVAAVVAVPGLRDRAATLFSALADRAAGGGSSAETRAQPSSVAVLPFRNLSPDPEQDYFSDGITEEIINALSSIPVLKVPARTSSFYFKGRDLPLRNIAEQLQVATVLDGSVRREGSQVRIIAQLIDASTERQLWSQTFDRQVGDVFAIQGDIAAAVANALEVRLAAQQRIAVVAGDPRAHDLYLRGLFLWNRRAATDLEQAIRFFREAIRIDPDYTPAHAGVALAYAVLPIAFAATITVAEAASEVEVAARRTLELDPDNAEARTALGYSLHWRWRWAEAERELARAIESNPDYATARQWYGELLAKTGNVELAETQMRRAVALDPLSLVINGDLGLVLMLSRKDREAVAQLEHTSSMDRGFANPYFLLHRIHLHRGEYDQAERAGRIWAELTDAVDPDDIVTLTRALQGAVDRSAAIEVLNAWEARPAPRYIDIATYYSLLNLNDEAIGALQEAVRWQHPMSAGIGLVPWFDNIRGDPRFQTLLRTMGLPHRAVEAG
jgi:adenylate cyclase